MTKTILITGSSSGFGKATALRFHSAGWNVVATMRDTAAWAEAPSDRFFPIPLDVTDPVSIRGAFDAGIQQFGHIDAVANIAGVGLFSVFETTTEQTVRSVFETNLFGPMEIIRVAIPHLRANGGGNIINLTSASSMVPEPLMAVYSASKAALDNFTEAVRFELAPQNIVVSLIEPGFVPTTGLVGKLWAGQADLVIPLEYQEIAQRRMAFFSSEPTVDLATADDVAGAILASIDDKSGRLRWVVGADQDERMRMRHETSEADYIAWSWNTFAPAI